MASTVHRWVRRLFLVWAVTSTGWVAGAFVTRGVDPSLLASSSRVEVVDRDETLEFRPRVANGKPGVVFLCGAGVGAEAYAPLLRPLAEAGHPVVIVRLPYRLAPLRGHKEEAVSRVGRAMAEFPGNVRWVVAGHSLGAALACRVAFSPPPGVAALVLVGTTHPTFLDLSELPVPVTKVYGTADGVAPMAKMKAHRELLPDTTRWVEIPGGNHSQFGHYGRQLLDGRATVGREQQQRITREAIAESLRAVEAGSQSRLAP